jgi:hypothetical protein
VIVAEGQHAEAVHDALYAELARGIVLPETGEGKDGWSFPLVNYLPVAPVHEPECQLVNHGVLVQLDSVDTEPMDACNALTAPSEGVRREHVMA